MGDKEIIIIKPATGIVSGSVQTMSGDVRADKIMGSTLTMSGDITSG